jgi:transposase-like protein
VTTPTAAPTPGRPNFSRRRLLAALYADRGMTTAAVARSLGIDWRTARRWIATGRVAWSADAERCRAELVAVLGAELVDRLVAGGQIG